MKLRCGSVLHALRNQPIIVTDKLGIPSVLPVTSKLRRSLVGQLPAEIHNAAKYIFDSGSDQDVETVQAVRETAVNMMEFNLFHLPHPVMWIEDPFEDSYETARNYYLARELPDHISILFFQEIKVGALGGASRLIVYPFPLTIDLRQPRDEFQANVSPHAMPAFMKGLSEAVYSFKKLIVCLYTRGTVTEAVEPRPGEQSRAEGRNRSYPHHVIRVPLSEAPVSEAAGTRRGPRSVEAKPKRAKLVRGYVWGFKTRPVDEQRWISAYWRNLDGTPPVSQEHYRVG